MTSVNSAPLNQQRPEIIDMRSSPSLCSSENRHTTLFMWIVVATLWMLGGTTFLRAVACSYPRRLSLNFALSFVVQGSD